MIFELPDAVKDLVIARNKLKSQYEKSGLNFTFDGNLVGDIGEAIAHEIFGLELNTRSSAGIDGYVVIKGSRKSVQVKSTGVKGGPAFRKTEIHSDYLLFFSFDFEKCVGELVYNGPEIDVLNHLLKNENWKNGSQRQVPFAKVRQLGENIPLSQRIPINKVV